MEDGNGSEPWRAEGRPCACGTPLADDTDGGRAAREAIARRAYEISLSPTGGTPVQNWLRAERERRSQYGRYP